MEADHSRRRLLVMLALLAVYLIWGSTYLGIRVAIETLPPFTMGGARFLLAGLVLMLYLRARGAAWPSARQWLASAAIGVLLLGGGNGAVCYAEQWIASGLAAVWIATVPLTTALFEGLWGRWPTRLEWLGLMVGLGGVVILNLEDNLAANPQGAIALTIAVVTWSFGSAWSCRLDLPRGLMASAAQMLTGGLFMLLLGALVGERITVLPSARSALAFAYLTVFGSFIAYSAYAYLLQTVRPTIATSYAYVNPLVAVALGAWLIGEPITRVAIVAMGVILAGVALLALARQPRTEKSV
ncbi:MAG: drug/metabolite exporter YedA [Nevskiales bacterium]